MEDKEAPGSGSPDAELVAGLPYWSNVNYRHYWETNTHSPLDNRKLGNLQFGHLQFTIWAFMTHKKVHGFMEGSPYSVLTLFLCRETEY